MPNRLDYRHHPEAKELRQKLPEMQYTPLVGATDLREITRVFEGLPALKYPVNSAGELIDQLGGGEQPIPIAGVDVDLLLMIKRMPAYYFPIAGLENFVEKMAELIRANRKQADAPSELKRLKGQLPDLRYPIETADDLLKVLGNRRSIAFRGREMETKEALKKVRHADLFPIRSEKDFDRKVGALIATRELIIKD